MVRQAHHDIVILGAGFAGLRCALELAKKIHKIPGYRIILVDKDDIHIYTPDLYEIATAYYPVITEACITQLRDTVALKIRDITKGKPIEFLEDRIISISPDDKKITLQKHGELSYEYLVVTLGSVTNFRNIPGLEEFSYPLKTVTDALSIQCHLDIYFQTLWKNHVEKEVNIFIIGGGATGVEFACELYSYLHKLCKKYRYEKDRVHLTLLEGKNELVGFGAKLSQKIEERLKNFGVRVKLGSYITAVSREKIEIKDPKGMKTEELADIVIWAGGVKPNPLIAQSFSSGTKNGALFIKPTLSVKSYPNIFAAGDNAFLMDIKTKRPVPWFAQAAFEQGKILADNIAAAVRGGWQKNYRFHFKGIVIPAGGKFAFCKMSAFVFSGWWCWVLRRLIDFRYLISIMPFKKALKKWRHNTKIYTQND